MYTPDGTEMDLLEWALSSAKAYLADEASAARDSVLRRLQEEDVQIDPQTAAQMAAIILGYEREIENTADRYTYEFER